MMSRKAVSWFLFVVALLVLVGCALFEPTAGGTKAAPGGTEDQLVKEVARQVAVPVNQVAAALPVAPLTQVESRASGTAAPVARVIKSGDRTVVTITFSRVYFDFDFSGEVATEKSKESGSVVKRNAEIRRSQPILHVKVDGPCDDRTNESLSDLGKRCAAVLREILRVEGVDVDRLQTIEAEKATSVPASR